MDDLKSVTVGYLRELARKHLGSGYSKLKKEELIAALAAYVPALAKLARLAGITLPRKRAAANTPDGKKTERVKTRTEGASKAKAPTEAKSAAEAAAPQSKARKTAPFKKAPAAEAPATPAREQDVGQGRVSAPQRVAAKRASEKPGEAPSARPAKVVNFPPKPRSSREPASEVTPAFMAPMMASGGGGGGGGPPSGGGSGPSGPSHPEDPPPPPEQHAAEPLVEGFFVARVMGEGEARSHHLMGEPPRESAPMDRPEREGGARELPPVYEDDTTLLLPRDPYTLFVSWDFSAASRNRAVQGLDSPRAVLKVFDGEGLVREVDVALESRSYYLHELTPGRPYRVEVHFVGSDGRSRRIGSSSNRIRLPSVGPSQDTSIRFLHVPTRMPEPQAVPEPVPPARAQVSTPEEREYVTWHRVNLPGSGGFEAVPEVRRERAAPAVSEEQPGPHLEGPPRPAGASDQRYLESMERAPGASDQRYMESVERPAGASDQRYLESVERPAGASDQRYLEAVARPAGASDQRYVQGAEQTGGYAYLESPQRAAGASDQRYLAGTPAAAGARYLESPGRAAGASDMRYLDSPGRVAGTSDMRYLDSPGRVAGASDMRYLDSPGRAAGASDMRYLDSPGRAAGASDARYLDSPGRAAGASDARYLESPSRVAGASDMRYLESPPGASDMRYLESPGRAAGASDARYLESPGRVPGASDMRYLESPPRAAGASDQRYLEYVARPPGASDQRYSEAAPSPGGSSEKTPSRKPPSGSGHS